MRIVLFGGTTEGRELAQALPEGRIELHVCVATEYGARLLPQKEHMMIHQGRRNEEEICSLLLETAPAYCLDATHPYAAAVTENVQNACRKLKIPYIRVERQREDYGDFICVENVTEAAEFLKGVSGNIFITTGSKELAPYQAIPDYRNRCFLRVLPVPEALQKCSDLGFEKRNVIAMQGPFSEELNYAMLRQTKSSWMVTKDSGKEGGYQEKCEAALRAGVKLLVVKRPERKEAFPEMKTLHLAEAVQFLTSFAPEAKEKKRKVFLISAGPGSLELLTEGALAAIRESDLLIGAERVLAICQKALGAGEKKPVFACCQKEAIAEFLRAHPAYVRPALVYSGDIGLYSGARGIRALLSDFEIEEISGVSSPVCFLNKLGVAWEEVRLVSCHGRKENLLSRIREENKVCALLGEKNQIAEISEKLLLWGMDQVKITVGEKISYPEERIVSGKPSEMRAQLFDPLSLALFENPKAEGRKVCAGISDQAFLRGKVPMTKEEIRTLALSKLRLTEDAVLYDVGAGTGSLSIEAAQLCVRGQVYAIEQKAEAAELIRSNRAHFRVENLEVVEGTAPACLKELPPPTHVFIGGSSGKLVSLILQIRERNPAARFVITAVTLETISVLAGLKERIPELPEMEMIQVQVARSKRLGASRLMEAENPIVIASF